MYQYVSLTPTAFSFLTADVTSHMFVCMTMSVHFILLYFLCGINLKKLQASDCLSYGFEETVPPLSFFHMC